MKTLIFNFFRVMIIIALWLLFDITYFNSISYFRDYFSKLQFRVYKIKSNEKYLAESFSQFALSGASGAKTQCECQNYRILKWRFGRNSWGLSFSFIAMFYGVFWESNSRCCCASAIWLVHREIAAERALGQRQCDWLPNSTIGSSK